MNEWIVILKLLFAEIVPPSIHDIRDYMAIRFNEGDALVGYRLKHEKTLDTVTWIWAWEWD